MFNVTISNETLCLIKFFQSLVGVLFNAVSEWQHKAVG